MFILVNLKAYSCDPVTIAQAAEDVATATDVRIAVAPQAAHLERVAETGVETWAQHISPIEPSSATGSTLPEAVADAGAVGTLLNHSEQQLSLQEIEAGITAATRTGLKTVICANTPQQAAAVAGFQPDAVAIEPPALIGTGTPVSHADPEIVTNSIDAAATVGEIPIFCGAGISTGDDVAAAADLGAEGVLLASGVAKADNPRTAIESLVAPLIE